MEVERLFHLHDWHKVSKKPMLSSERDQGNVFEFLLSLGSSSLGLKNISVATSRGCTQSWMCIHTWEQPQREFGARTLHQIRTHVAGYSQLRAKGSRCLGLETSIGSSSVSNSMASLPMYEWHSPAFIKSLWNSCMSLPRRTRRVPASSAALWDNDIT